MARDRPDAQTNAVFESGRRDLNSGPLVPQTSALTRLRHAPRRAHRIRRFLLRTWRSRLSRDLPARARDAVSGGAGGAATSASAGVGRAVRFRPRRTAHRAAVHGQGTAPGLLSVRPPAGPARADGARARVFG